MKRLLEDPRDEVERLLMEAGAHHEPPRGGKVRLMAALGVGGTLSFLSSEVFAWLGTSAGKATLVVTALGAAAGGAYAIGVSPDPATAVQSVPTSTSPAAVSAAPTRIALEERVETVKLGEPLRSRAPTAEPEPRKRRAWAPRERQETSPALSDGDSKRLGEETRWVDRLRVAAEQGEREVVRRLLDEYGERFPEGQLRPEVDRIENELE